MAAGGSEREGGNGRKPFRLGSLGASLPPPAPPAGALIHVQRGAQDGDREMCQKRRVIIKLDPADDAVVLQILRHFRLANSEMFREFGLKTAGVRRVAAAAGALRGAAPAANQIAEPYAECLTCFDIVGTNLIGV